MVVESVAILSICCCIIVSFVKSGNADYAVATLPVACVPAAHLLAFPLEGLTKMLLPQVSKYILLLGFDLVGLAVSCFLIALFSGKIHSKKNKRIYVALLGTYCIVLTAIFVNHIVLKYVL